MDRSFSFVIYIATAVGLEYFEQSPYEYFCVHMAQNILQLQGSTEAITVSSEPRKPVETMDDMAMEIVQCRKGLDSKQVCFSVSAHNHQLL